MFLRRSVWAFLARSILEFSSISLKLALARKFSAVPCKLCAVQTRFKNFYFLGNTFEYLRCYINVKSLETLKKAGFAKIYEKYAPMVYRRCLQLLRDDAEASDLMQDVFLRIYSASERLDMDSPSSLLWNTATRLCLNRIRDKRRRGLDVDSSSLLLSIACAEDEHDDYETKNVLAKLFSKEPESSRTMAVLHFVDGMTLEETAREVGLSVSGVRKRLRGLQAKVKTLEVQ